MLLTLTKEVVCLEPLEELRVAVLCPRIQDLDHLLLKDVFVVRLSLLEDLYCGVPDLNQFVVKMLLSPP